MFRRVPSAIVRSMKSWHWSTWVLVLWTLALVAVIFVVIPLMAAASCSRPSGYSDWNACYGETSFAIAIGTAVMLIPVLTAWAGYVVVWLLWLPIRRWPAEPKQAAADELVRQPMVPAVFLAVVGGLLGIGLRLTLTGPPYDFSAKLSAIPIVLVIVVMALGIIRFGRTRGRRTTIAAVGIALVPLAIGAALGPNGYRPVPGVPGRIAVELLSGAHQTWNEAATCSRETDGGPITYVGATIAETTPPNDIGVNVETYGPDEAGATPLAQPLERTDDGSEDSLPHVFVGIGPRDQLGVQGPDRTYSITPDHLRGEVVTEPLAVRNEDQAVQDAGPFALQRVRVTWTCSGG